MAGGIIGMFIGFIICALCHRRHDKLSHALVQLLLIMTCGFAIGMTIYAYIYWGL